MSNGQRDDRDGCDTQICHQREKCDESAELGLARNVTLCDGTDVSGLELEIPCDSDCRLSPVDYLR